MTASSILCGFGTPTSRRVAFSTPKTMVPPAGVVEGRHKSSQIRGKRHLLLEVHRLPFALADEPLELLRCQVSAPWTTDFGTTNSTDFTNFTNGTDLLSSGQVTCRAAFTCFSIQGYVRAIPSLSEIFASHPRDVMRALLKLRACTPTGPGT